MILRKTVEKIIGKTYADKLDEPLFVVGTMSYSRRQMVEDLGCANFVAATRLSKVLNKLRVHTSRQLFMIDPASLFRVHGIGESCMFVAMSVIDANGFDVDEWWDRNFEKHGDNVVKFSAYKHQVTRRAKKRKQVVA